MFQRNKGIAGKGDLTLTFPKKPINQIFKIKFSFPAVLIFGWNISTNVLFCFSYYYYYFYFYIYIKELPLLRHA